MWHPNTAVRLCSVERRVAREGFVEPYHRFTFALASDGVPEARYSVWIHPSWPEDQQEAIARAFLRRRLLDLAEAAAEGAMDWDDTEDLWRQVQSGGTP